MSKTLDHTIEELETLSKEQQDSLLSEFQKMVNRAKIEDDLVRAEARGGETPSDTVIDRFKKEYGS